MKDANGNEIPDPSGGVPGGGTIGGWAKSVTMGGPPQATIPVSEVPGVLAAAPGAYLSATADAVKRDTGIGAAPADGGQGPAVAPNDPPVSPGGTSDLSGVDAELGGMAAQKALEDYLVNPGSGKAAPPFYRPEGDNYSAFGGTEGKARFNQAYDQRAQSLEGAIRESGKAQQEKAAELSQFYNEQSKRDAIASSAMLERQRNDAADLKLRQENLDKATKYYSDDLADQGKFWQNPGNIVSAIAYSLLPIFSNDPAVGAKLIGQAIDRDMASRQHAASQTLGALQSNLAGYHKLAADRQAGDLLAQSEAHRIAANEVERIGAKFQSRISAATTEAIAQDLRQKQDLLRAEAYSKLIYAPAQKQEKGLFDARGQGYDGAWKKYGVDDPAPLALGRAVQGDIAGTPSVAQDQANGGFTSLVKPATIAAINAANNPNEAAFRAAQEGRLPGSSNLAAALRASIARQAVADAHGQSSGPAYDEAKYKLVKAANDNIDKATAQLAPLASKRAALQSLLRDASIIEKSERLNGRDPKDFLGKARGVLPESVVQGYEQLERSFRGPPANKAEALEAYRKDAVSAFRQRLAGQMSNFYNSISGGAISPTEREMLERSISGKADFNFAHNWLKNQSNDVGAQEKEIIKQLGPIGGLLYMTRTGLGQSTNLAVVAPRGPKPPPEGRGEYSAPYSGGSRTGASNLSSRAPGPGEEPE